ncbi:hypothetical protein COT29_00250 [Candidatus Micrarchaeota archaeon CG08_land_8_20_14_0_20_59_11]|nr:MAG: hypothetical protein COT29_00250 [Candidatus Micrarchaeota archaeon CG08_land_8_20_14_0_20_59_11]
MTLYSGEARLTPSQKRFDDFINLNPVGKPACGASVLARSSSTSNDFEKHFDVSFDPVVSCGADGKHVDFLVYSRGASPDKLWSENLNFEVTFGRMLGESFKVTIPFVFDSDGEVVEGISPEEISGFLFVEDDENLKWAQKKQGVWSEIKAEFKKQIIGVPNPENPELIVESFVVGEPEEIGKADAVSFSKKDTYYSLGGQVFKKGNPAFLVSEDTLKVYLKKNKAFFDLPQGVKEVNLETGEETLYCPSLCNASAFESGSLNVFVYCSNTESIVSIRGEGGSCSTAQVLARGNKITDFLAEEQEIYWVGEENGAYSVKVFADGKTKTIFENPKTALPASISVYDGGLFGGKWLYWIEYDTETHQNRIKRINV